MFELVAASDDLILPFWMNVFYCICVLVAIPVVWVFWRGLRGLFRG